MTLPRLPVLAASALMMIVHFACATALAADPPETVLARRGDVEVTRADWDAELARVPAQDRAEFASSPRRIYAVLERAVNNRELAVLARQKGIPVDPSTAALTPLEQDKVLAEGLLAQTEKDAARDFDQRRPAFERRAREVYELDPRKFMTPESVAITVLFFAARKDGPEGASRRADEALAKIRGGADIADLAATMSDDAKTREMRGRMGPVTQAALDPNIARRVFALKNKGDISESLRGRDGFWVVRLDERWPPTQPSFDEVKGTLMEGAKQQHLDAARTAVLASAGGDKQITFNAEAIDALRSSPAKASP